MYLNNVYYKISSMHYNYYTYTIQLYMSSLLYRSINIFTRNSEYLWLIELLHHKSYITLQ